jgi:ankyrin repeat protein
MMDQQQLDRELYQAAESQDLGKARLLLRQGANPDADGFGWYNCALQASSRRESVELVHLLLSHGADIDAHGGYHGSALIAAAQYGRLQIVQLLINSGANLNLRSRYGTALAVARDKGYEDVAEVLARAGAAEWRPNVEDIPRFD